MRVLIFGTCYIDNEDKKRLAQQWCDLHERLNPGCDLLLVDSNSPVEFSLCFRSWCSSAKTWRKFHSFPDNIGHLARHGGDGWGRAFCWGLDYAVQQGYDYVAHVEGDSLLSIPVQRVSVQMRRTGTLVASVPVLGTHRLEREWVETGLMFFSVPYLRDEKLTERYDWRATKKYPHTPEWHLYQLTQEDLRFLPWIHNIRDDRKRLTVDRVVEYDWITHTTPEIFAAFARRSETIDA